VGVQGDFSPCPLVCQAPAWQKVEAASCRLISPLPTAMKEMYMFRLILVRFDRDSGRFEDEEFNKFCAEQNIVRIEKEFINTGGEIYYSFFIEYHSRKAGNEKPDMAKLSERELEQYNRLREWRNSTRSRMGFIGYASSTLLLQSIWGRNQQAGLTVWNAVVAGTTMPTTAPFPIGTTTMRLTATTI
jgi:hypothetical protein